MDLIKRLKTPDYLIGYAETRIGGRSENQDSYGCAETPRGFVVTVCDGMGGGPGGKTASTIAVNEIINGIIESNPDETDSNALLKAIQRANHAILSRSFREPALRGMGSTCTVLLINQDCALAAHVGDSRVYQLRGGRKQFRTFDHSMVFDLVRQKVISEEQARLSAQSNVITRALGLGQDVQPDISCLPYCKGDRFMLCTDGIHGAIPEDQLLKLLAKRGPALGAVVDDIATTIDGEGRRSGGGHDNLTLAVIQPKINSTLKPKMTSKAKIIIAALAAALCVSLVFNFCSGGSCPATAVGNQDSIGLVISRQTDSIKTLTRKIDRINKIVSEKSMENTKLRKELDNLKKK